MAYACKDRPPFRQTLAVQDGWYVNDCFTRTPRMILIPFRMAHDCQYQRDDKYKDPQCAGCKHKVLSTKEAK